MTKSTDLVVKSNSLVEARYKLSIWESRVFAKMVTMIEKDDQEFTTYEIEIRELMRFFETKAHNDFERIKAVPEMLIKKTIKIPVIDEGKEAFLVANMISSAIIPKEGNIDDNSVLKLSFDPKLKPYLLKLKKKFLQYDIKNVLRISSPHSIRVYELLKQFEGTGWRQISIEEFKAILGIEDKYKKYSHLKDRVIRQAEKDLKKYTDIYFTFDEIKKRRKVIAIKFFIYKNTPGRKEKETTQEGVLPGQEKLFDVNEPSEVLKALIKEDIAPKKAQSLINEIGEDVVALELKHGLKELKLATNISNSAGFLISKIEAKSYTSKQAILQSEKEQKKKKKDAEKEQQQLHKVKIEELRTEYKSHRNKAVAEMVKDLDKGQIEMLVDEYGKSNIYILKELRKAEKQGREDEAREHKCYLFAKHLKEEKLHTFEKYLELVYQFKIDREREMIVKIN